MSSRCPPDAREMDILRCSITALLAVQNGRLDAAFDALALGQQGRIACDCTLLASSFEQCAYVDRWSGSTYGIQ